ncbi:MAG: SDR family NAD(P)-dependent oxidoreductase [Halanaeroarchaeum sp.]
MSAIETDLSGQVAVVIGGTTGIGRAIAEALADSGADVVPTSRTESSVEDAAAAVGSDLVVTTDVTDREDVVDTFERVTDEVGDVNVLVNSAGVIQESKPVTEVDDEEWDLVLDTNLYGVFLAAQLYPEYMAADNRTILNIGSMNGEIAVKGLSSYVSSKFGVKGLTQTLALEYADDDVRVNALAPGYVETRQNEEALESEEVKQAIHGRTPLGRYATRDEVADAALFMVSPGASFVTGETLVVDGGFSVK